MTKLEASRIELQWRKSISELLCTFTSESDKNFFNVTRNVRSPNFARRAHCNTKMQESASHHFIICEVDLQLRIASCQELILIKLGASCRRLRGSLEGNPEPGDRLHFVFVFVPCVACVQAGEAKLRVPARCRVFLLGRPRLWEVLLRSSRPLCEAQDVVCVGVLRQNGSKSVPRCPL